MSAVWWTVSTLVEICQGVHESPIPLLTFKTKEKVETNGHFHVTNIEIFFLSC